MGRNKTQGTENLTPEQANLVEEAVNATLDALPQSWDHATLSLITLGPASKGTLTIKQGAETTEKFRCEAYDLLLKLRREMHTPDTGAWLSVQIEISPQGDGAIKFNYDSEPPWGSLEPDDEAYAEDLKRFPRSLENTPEWLRARLEKVKAIERGEIEPQWVGLRFQTSFTPEGDLPTSLEPQEASDGWQQAETIAATLGAQGIETRTSEETEELGEEHQIRYPKITIRLGEGYCALAFWAEEILWSVDVSTSESNLKEAQQVTRTVINVTEKVTGWKLADASITSIYERSILKTGTKEVS